MNKIVKIFKRLRFSNKFITSILKINTLLRYFLYMGGNRKVSPPSNFKLIFSDDFNNIDENIWRFEQPWGDFHDGFRYQYYDKDCVQTDETGLKLHIKNKPKTFIKSELPEWRQTDNLPDEFTIPISVGLISSKQTFKYGWFESWIQLPKGKDYWSSFWLSGLKKWPPEIDVYEGISYNGEKYEGNLFNTRIKLPFQKIVSNVIYSKENGTDSVGGYNTPIAKATDRFVQYVCHWEKDFIKIYIDGSLVLFCDDKKVLADFNGDESDMYIIFNHATYANAIFPVNESVMWVKNIRVYQ